ncbi:redoxin domain-containing protein [Maribellus sp. CM-23]|uniref:TlpA family protein disulfide reductase n=1 Tax=Maribellus sp. CM-23 TaxID=2781026 RepID=UPI001F478413|nr:TlpA family protein disulfide reductase [Maribellus sp. CM-23]MCE4562698.1 redoxin domain-containing protein [Maribellus sp. CM-23]
MNKLFTFLLILFSVLVSNAQDEFTLAKQGEAAPDFSFETAPGKMVKLSELKGKVVWINFFATWCPPCRKELPHLQTEVYDQYKNNQDFVLIILGREHSWEELNKFKAEQNFTMPFSPDHGRKVFSLYAQQNIPRNFIVDKEGNIAYSSIGFNEEDFAKIKATVASLLAK